MKKKTLVLLVIALFSLSGCAIKVATHAHSNFVGFWGLNADPNDKTDRIYSGTGETILLTLAIINPAGGSAKVEILVNGSPIVDGVLDKELGIDGRTWKLKDVHTVDVAARTTDRVSGNYVISVPL